MGDKGLAQGQWGGEVQALNFNFPYQDLTFWLRSLTINGSVYFNQTKLYGLF